MALRKRMIFNLVSVAEIVIGFGFLVFALLQYKDPKNAALWYLGVMPIIVFFIGAMCTFWAFNDRFAKTLLPVVFGFTFVCESANFWYSLNHPTAFWFLTLVLVSGVPVILMLRNGTAKIMREELGFR